MAAVVNVMVKRRDNLITSCGDERDECKRTAEDASKGHKWHQNRGVALPWEKHGGYLLTVMRCPVYRRRESHLGFRTELENLAGDVEGKRHKRMNCEAESTDASARGGLPRGSDEAG